METDRIIRAAAAGAGGKTLPSEPIARDVEAAQPVSATATIELGPGLFVEHRAILEVKGKGRMHTYLLRDNASETTATARERTQQRVVLKRPPRRRRPPDDADHRADIDRLSRWSYGLPNVTKPTPPSWPPPAVHLGVHHPFGLLAAQPSSSQPSYGCVSI